MFAIEVTTTFQAEHALRLPGGGEEPRHAHDFHVAVQIEAEKLDALSTVVDFHLVERALEGIVAAWRGKCFNDIEPFASTVNPSAERVAERIARLLLAPIETFEGDADRGLRLVEVRITEAPGCLAIYRP